MYKTNSSKRDTQQTYNAKESKHLSGHRRKSNHYSKEYNMIVHSIQITLMHILTVAHLYLNKNWTNISFSYRSLRDILKRSLLEVYVVKNE